MNSKRPPGIRAHIHPEIFPYGNIEDGTPDEVNAAENWLRNQGCTHARGPMGPSTWYPYRAMVESDGRPTFLGEPTFSSSVWESQGYSICAHYVSAIAPNRAQIASANDHSKSLRKKGWTIRDLTEMNNFASALKQFHLISTSAFRNAFAYTSLNFTDFQQLYAPLESLIEPHLVLIAISPSGEPGGFCFSIPDRLNPDTKTFIVKTLAVAEPYRKNGIGSWLTASAHQRAHSLGWTQGGIHALMWTGSHSRRISRQAGTIFRRYALYEKRL